MGLQAALTPGRAVGAAAGGAAHVPGTVRPVGVVLIVLALLLLPVAVLVSGAVASGILGTLLTKDAEARHEGSELVELNT